MFILFYQILVSIKFLDFILKWTTKSISNRLILFFLNTDLLLFSFNFYFPEVLYC